MRIVAPWYLDAVSSHLVPAHDPLSRSTHLSWLLQQVPALTHEALPWTYWPLILLAFGMPAVLTYMLTPWVIRLANRTGAVDRPRERHIHTRPVPKFGGLAMAGAIGLTLPVLWIAGRTVWPGQDVPREMLALGAGGFVAVVVGAIDDLHELPPGLHFLGQLGVALTAVIILWPTAVLGPLMLIGAGPNAQARSAVLRPLFALLGVPVDTHGDLLCSAAGSCTSLQIVTVLFVIGWLVSMMNTVNFVDGIDGLASGVVAIAAVVLALLAATVAHGPWGADAVLLPLLVGGAAAGFLPFNWYPARIFMADTGAQFLGFALGLVALAGGARFGTALIVLAVPILDVAWAIVRRRSSFRTRDQGHLHHRLLDLKLGHRRIVALYYAPAILFGIASLVLHDWRQKAVLLVVVVAVVTTVMSRLARVGQKNGAEDRAG